jgi:photosystem II stability/assembly factor-like uncharacterized protein
MVGPSTIALLLHVLLATDTNEAGVPQVALPPSATWRCVGPPRGGRVAAVAGHADQPLTYWMGACGGGVWKTEDGGGHWNNVSDKFFGGSIGAVAVAPSDPNVVYVGGGEVTVRGNWSPGWGAWKTVDAGHTWQSIGLADAQCIPRIRVHPRDANLVYAAVLGHLFGPSEERGVYRSKDGGTTWERVLHVSPDAGACDLLLDPANPRTVWASTWRVRRTPWSLESGGDGSGLWRSDDGGDTWNELSRRPGLPGGTLGIIGVAVSPARPGRIWALVEADDGGLFRSDDDGATWQRVNEDRNLRQRAWYYSRVFADPKDSDRVYVINVSQWRSDDGGRTFAPLPTPHGDHHDLWIAPNDPNRMIQGDDGGAAVSYDRGQTWSSIENQPTAQLYRVAIDDHFPWRIYGAQQDNSTVRLYPFGDSATRGGANWEITAGGESGWLAPDPRDPEIVYGGSYGGYLERYDHRSGESRNVSAWPDNPIGHGADAIEWRFQWNFPLLFSRHEPGTLWAGAQALLATRDDGQSFAPISPDLTRNDRSKMGPSGGPITKDNTGVEVYGTLFAVAESAKERGVLWVGSDDGRIHVTRDGGAKWHDVTPKLLPEWAQINAIEAHPFEPGGLYVAATRYKQDDFKPYLLATTDWGHSWRLLGDGLPEGAFARVVRADPVRRGLLFAGTERGAFVSFDDGSHFQPLQQGLPEVPITDLAVKDETLVAATQGRSFWILDELALLRALPDGEVTAATLFPPAPLRRRDQPAVLHWFLPAAPAAGERALRFACEGGRAFLHARRRLQPPRLERDVARREGLRGNDPVGRRSVGTARAAGRLSGRLRGRSRGRRRAAPRDARADADDPARSADARRRRRDGGALRSPPRRARSTHEDARRDHAAARPARPARGALAPPREARRLQGGARAGRRHRRAPHRRRGGALPDEAEERPGPAQLPDPPQQQARRRRLRGGQQRTAAHRAGARRLRPARRRHRSAAREAAGDHRPRAAGAESPRDGEAGAGGLRAGGVRAAASPGGIPGAAPRGGRCSSRARDTPAFRESRSDPVPLRESAMRLHHALLSLVATASLAAPASAQLFAPLAKFDDGSSEECEQIHSPPIAGDFASIDLDATQAGKRACAIRVRVCSCNAGKQAVVGIYPDDLGVDISGHTPDLFAPLTQVTKTLPLEGCDVETEFDFPDIVLPTSGVHLVFRWKVPAKHVEVCVDDDSTSGRSYFGTGGGTAATPRASGNWMMRLAMAVVPNRLTINGSLATAVSYKGALTYFTFWGTAPGQPWTLWKGNTTIATGVTGGLACPNAGEIAIDSSTLLPGKYKATSSLGTTPGIITPFLFISPYGPNCPYGRGDDGVRESWFRPSGVAPSGGSDFASVAYLEPTVTTTISKVSIVYRNEGCLPRTLAMVGVFPANYAIDPDGKTPDVAAALSLASNVAIPTEVSGTFEVALPSITLAPGTLYVVVVQWTAGDTGVWIGSDTDGTDDPTFDHRPGVQAVTSGYSIDGYATPAVPLNENLMMRLE